MISMTAHRILAAALSVTALVMWLAPLGVQVALWGCLLVLVAAGYAAITLFRWTRPRVGIYRRRHSRW